MAFEFRYDFMSNAVYEAAMITNEREHVEKNCGDAYTKRMTYSWMKHYWTQKERDDWFAMYAMGEAL